MTSSDPQITGLFDFQINGFGGVDFQQDNLDSAGLRVAVAALRGHGVSRILATLTTAPVEQLCRRLENFEALCAQDPDAARMVAGYHLEGPWLNPEAGYCGAHPPEPMHAPDEREFEKLQEAAAGRIRMVTLAPEWPGSPAVIARMRAEGVQVALGHTNADDSQIDAAIRAGARFCTHLGNGVPGVLPRHVNVVQRLLARDELIACFIPDGIHLPPFVLRNFYRAKPPNRVLFTTDAMSGAGAGPGIYRIGELTIEVGDDGVAWQPGRTGFAGSTLTPDEGVRRTARYLGLTLAEATRLWSTAAEGAFDLSPAQRQ